MSPAQHKDAIDDIMKQLKMPVTSEAMSMEALINENLEVIPNSVPTDEDFRYRENEAKISEVDQRSANLLIGMKLCQEVPPPTKKCLMPL